MRVHEIVDAALDRRAGVVGSLPPEGRDLDVLVREPETVARLERALRAAGFAPLGGSWLRFAHMTAEIVELIPASSYGVDAAALDSLFAEAIVLAGCAHLARPSPVHVVLLIARRGADSGELAPRRRRRLEAALEEDPAAWRRAAAAADAWDGPGALDALDRCLSRPDREPQRAARGLLPSGVRARLGAVRDRARGRRRGAVIALSGLDGSGKSTQARALADALGHLGHDVAIEWTRIGTNERLTEAADRVERALTRMDGAPGLRTQLRATVLALEHLWAQRRLTGGFLARGYVVICDRYTLDSIVSLRYLLGERRRFPLQRAMLRALTRRPVAAFLLEVSPATAWERKGEHGLEWLRRHHALYREERAALRVERLDGERPPEELAARIAHDSWDALRRGLR